MFQPAFQSAFQPGFRPAWNQGSGGAFSPAVPGYLRPGGTTLYRRPDGTSLYKRPAS